MKITQFFPTQWLQVWGLAGVQGAITISWVIYGLYLPKLFQQMGLPDAWVGPIFMLESAIAILMEPLMGILSDQAQNHFGTKMPLITFGTILASALFIAIPALVILGGTSEIMRWIFLVVIVAWSIAMTIFRSPAMSLLGKFAFDTQLPQAASILTLVGGLATSMRSLSSKFILSFGPAVAFTVGSIVLLGTVAFLRSILSQRVSFTEVELEPERIDFEGFASTTVDQPFQFLPTVLLGVIGVSVGWGVRLTMGEVFPRVLQVEVIAGNLDILMGSLAIALALFAIASGYVADRLGNIPVMVVSTGIVAACLGLLSISHGAFVVIVIAMTLVAGLSGVLNGSIPLALTVMSQRWGGLGIGMYFGGFSAANALFGYLFPQPAQMITFANAILMAAIALLVAGGTIASVGKLSKT
jgi:Na+/melibiose symporter-like transporter